MTTPSQARTAYARVVTDSPGRYAKQLVAHLGRRVEWVTEGVASAAVFGGGTGRVLVGEGVLTLVAESGTAEGLAQVQDVLGRHLERFGARNELAVAWQPGAAAS